MLRNHLSITTPIFVALFLILLFWCPAGISGEHPFSAKDVLNGVQSIKRYHASLHTLKHPGSPADTFDLDRYDELKVVVFGLSGKKMKMTYSIIKPERPAGEETTFLYDGTWLWFEEKKSTKARISTMKVHIPTLSPDIVKEPFTTFMGISGTGIYSDTDLPGTFYALLEDFSFADGVRDIALGAIAYTGTLKPTQPGQPTTQTAKNFSTSDNRAAYCRLLVSEKNNRIIGYTIGESPERPLAITTITYHSINQSLPNNVFTYVPSKGVVVPDFTGYAIKNWHNKLKPPQKKTGPNKYQLSEAEKQAIDRKCREAWAKMRACLLNNDLEGALNYYLPGVRYKYKEKYEFLEKKKPGSIVAAAKRLPDPELVGFNGDLPHYILVREQDGKRHGYDLMFGETPSGWMIYSY